MQPSPTTANRLSAVLITIVIIIVTALLLGRMGGASWAGGEGYKAQSHLQLVANSFDATQTPPVIVETIARGETAEAPASVFSQYDINGKSLVLDENSSLTLIDGRQDQETFAFLTGRVLYKGAGTFTVRETKIKVDGFAILVNYSWLDQMDVYVLDGVATVSQVGREDMSIARGSGAHLDTLPPSDAPTDYSFVYQTDKRKEFYDWAFPRVTTGFTDQTPDGDAE